MLARGFVPCRKFYSRIDFDSQWEIRMRHPSIMIPVVLPLLLGAFDGETRSSAEGTVNGQDINVDDFKWKHRPLLIFASSDDVREYQDQIVGVNTHLPQLRDRDMVVIQIASAETGTFRGRLQRHDDGRALSAVAVCRLRKEYNIAPHEFAVILVGKDGTVKVRRGEPQPMSALFELIDSMPMRQREMRDR